MGANPRESGASFGQAPFLRIMSISPNKLAGHVVLQLNGSIGQHARCVALQARVRDGVGFYDETRATGCMAAAQERVRVPCACILLILFASSGVFRAVFLVGKQRARLLLRIFTT